MKIKLLLTLLTLSLFTLSCKKDATENAVSNEDINSIVVPENFKWNTARDVTFNIAIHDSRFQNGMVHVIEAFIGDPSAGGLAVAKGSVSLISSFKFKVEIPATVNEIYITKTAPDGSKFTQKVVLNSTAISLSVGSQNIVQSVSATGKNNTKSLAPANFAVAEISPDCTTGCDIVINSQPSGQTNLNGKTICVTKDNISIDLGNTSAGTLRICAKNVTLNNLNMDNNINIIVTGTGSLNGTNINWNGPATFKNFGTANLGNVTSRGTFYNGGTLTTQGFVVDAGTTTNVGTITASSNAKVKGTFNNDGTFNANSELVMEGTASKLNNSKTITVNNHFILEGTFVNTGTIEAKSNVTVNSNTVRVTNSNIFNALNGKFITNVEVINDGTMTVKEIMVNGNFTNNCKLLVTTNFANDGAVRNNSYIQVNDNTGLNKTLTLNNGSMFKTKSLDKIDGKIIGLGNNSLFQVTDQANVSFNGTIDGSVVFCYAKSTINANKFINGALQGCDIYIAKTDCNTEGFGVAPAPVKVDTDGDGVIDEKDDYPNDIKRAFKTYSPNYQLGGSTLAFEDSWPKQGDYDLNDVVISYKYLVVTNSSNQVVHIQGDYKLLATGGTNQNGSGILFNLPSGSAKNFSGTAGTSIEAGQDSVVVILFKNSRAEQSKWNTIPGETAAEAKEYTISFDVTDGPQIGTFGTGSYNPFIWNNVKGRGHETHLYGRNPTKLATLSLFGTEDDGGKGKGKYYSTNPGLPWGITIPTTPFAYPKESAPITKTYLRFGDWAKSGGNSHADWYSNTAGNYRNTANIFTK
jgi:LruC domain-containing protein